VLQACIREDLGDPPRELKRQKWRDSVANLDKLLTSVAFKEVVVRKGLQPSRFSYGQAPALPWIWMDKIVPILVNMRGNCRRWPIPNLNSKSVRKAFNDAAAARLPHVGVPWQK
jgi:hypothetical protein